MILYVWRSETALIVAAQAAVVTTSSLSRDEMSVGSILTDELWQVSVSRLLTQTPGITAMKILPLIESAFA